jgi:dCTP deaminase
MLWNDRQIRQWGEHGGLTPFVPDQVRRVDGRRVLSYGCGSFGYDIRIGDEFKVFTMPLDRQGVIDPLNFDPKLLQDCRGDVCEVPPNSFALACSIEHFRMPRNVTGIAIGKSTLARCGVIVNITPLEAGWEGVLTVEISNTTPLPCKIYANQGIAQILFLEGEAPAVSYADRAGKYQGQAGITLAQA